MGRSGSAVDTDQSSALKIWMSHSPERSFHCRTPGHSMRHLLSGVYSTKVLVLVLSWISATAAY